MKEKGTDGSRVAQGGSGELDFVPHGNGSDNLFAGCAHSIHMRRLFCKAGRVCTLRREIGLGLGRLGREATVMERAGGFFIV